MQTLDVSDIQYQFLIKKKKLKDSFKVMFVNSLNILIWCNFSRTVQMQNKHTNIKK